MLRRSGCVALAAFALVACGSSKSEEDKIRDNVASFLAAFRAGDGGKACSLLTKRGQKQVMNGQSGKCEDVVAKEARQLEAPGRRQLRRAKVTKVEFDNGTTATAYVDFGVKDSPLAPFGLVRKGGDWLITGAAS